MMGVSAILRIYQRTGSHQLRIETITASIVFVPSAGVFALTGDVNAFQGTFGAVGVTVGVAISDVLQSADAFFYQTFKFIPSS
jgi:hypothetical protein